MRFVATQFISVLALIAFVATAADAKPKKKRTNRPIVASAAPPLQQTEPDPAPAPVAATPVEVFEQLPQRTAAPPPVEKAPLGLVLGASFGGSGVIGGPQQGTVGGGVELGYRAPFWNRILGFAVIGSLNKVFLPRVAQSDGYTLAIAPAISVYLQKEAHIGRLQVGPNLRFTKIAISDAVATTTDGTWSMGALVSAGYLHSFGKAGQLGATVSYSFNPYYADNVLYVGHMLGASVSYLFEL